MQKFIIVISEKKKDFEWLDEMLGDSQEGRVVSRYSLHADVETKSGQISL